MVLQDGISQIYVLKNNFNGQIAQMSYITFTVFFKSPKLKYYNFGAKYLKSSA